MKRIIPLVLAMALLFSACSAPSANVNTEEFNTNYKFVFVHGLSGWGSYDKQNRALKYWGMFGGDLMRYLNSQGFDCYAASVDPYGSAWDRACELYAQLTGSVTDYGKEHSERCGHERFGRDFSNKPLIDKWDGENKINLLGHSFGGATIRLLAELMANGSKEERDAGYEDISPLFTGGKADWIYSVTALAAPHNGTSAYNANDGSVNVDGELSFAERKMSDMVNSSTKGSPDGRIESDYANYDLKIDNALELNKSISTLKNVYYFSFPCSCTVIPDDADFYYPEKDITEPMFVKSAMLMGRVTGVTDGGFEFGSDWLENDGLVNTISARAPFDSPQKEYAEGDNKSGIWYIMPTYHGDHLSLSGGMLKKNDVTGFYVEHLTRINKLTVNG